MLIKLVNVEKNTSKWPQFWLIFLASTLVVFTSWLSTVAMKLIKIFFQTD